jgi:hypothetical protein
MDWNPRYVSYAKANGRSPEAQREHDRKEWPGAAACPFILWMKLRFAEFRKQRPEAVSAIGLADHDAYDRWLADWADRVHVVPLPSPDPQLAFAFAAE